MENLKVETKLFYKYIKGPCGRPEVDFFEHIYPQMKGIALKTIKCAYQKLDPAKRENGFELFGLDFMID